MSTALANPAKMMAHGAPRVIHNDAELEAYTEALFQLTALERPSRHEVEAIELLTLLVERYERQRNPIPRRIRLQSCDFSSKSRICGSVT
jgi:HTH-type transcriptional regulator/antitoxin HigA